METVFALDLCIIQDHDNRAAVRNVRMLSHIHLRIYVHTIHRQVCYANWDKCVSMSDSTMCACIYVQKTFRFVEEQSRDGWSP